MVTINDIISVIKVILAIKKQRQADSTAYDILQTTLDVHLDVLQRMDAVFGNEAPTQKARDRLHKVVTDAQSAVTHYEKLTPNIGTEEYSRKFGRLTQEFQICVSALILYVSFTVQERNQIHQNLDPPIPSTGGGSAVFTIVREVGHASIPPLIVNAVLSLTKYNSMLEELQMDHQVLLTRSTQQGQTQTSANPDLSSIDSIKAKKIGGHDPPRVIDTSSTSLSESETVTLESLTSQLYQLRAQAETFQPSVAQVETLQSPVAQAEILQSPVAPVDTDLAQILQQGRALYQRYIQEHPNDLKICDWICLYDNDYSTVRAFQTYETAVQHYKGHKIRFCQQYYGPDVSGERLYPFVTTRFNHGPGLHPMLAYIDARVIHPEDPNRYHEVKFMIDTGATKSTGRQEVLIDQLGLEFDFGDAAEVVGGEVQMIYVQARISPRGLDGTYLPSAVVQIGYPRVPPIRAKPLDWLLGQNYLGLCGHVWANHRLVRIEHPF